METIILSNELEYPIKDIAQDGDNLIITVCGIADYPTFRATLTKESLETISVHTEGGTLSTVYESYTKLAGKYGIEENEDGTMNITVYLSKENELLKRIAVLEAEVEELKNK